MKYRVHHIAMALAAAFLSASAMADAVRLSGSTTVVNVVINPGKAAVEKSTGHQLQVSGSSSGRGLIDLAGSNADAAMVSEPMNIAAESAAAGGKAVDVSGMKFILVKNDEVLFIVHPSNGVSKLSWDQIGDIFTGKIKNWKDVGGKDAAIHVYGDTVTGGTRALLKHTVMKGGEYGPETKTQTSVKRAAEMVANDEAGFTGAGKGFVEAGKMKAIETKKLERPLAFVTVGEPKGATKAVIDAFIKEVK
jgi:phosphate transport system substrate-binding protein